MYNYAILPENLQDGMRRYIEDGIKPGHFLTACLANDFLGALGAASTQTWDYVFQVGMFLYQEVPGRGGSNCPWGSYEAVTKYCEQKRHEKP
jgi:hypothetical protein